MESMHEILDLLWRSNGPAVLATVIEVEGSAYRKAGASMLFPADGTRIGMISAGCLEEDLGERAKELIGQFDEPGEPRAKKIVYDMRAEDDLGWGRGAGCNGRVHVLLEVIDESFRMTLLKMRERLVGGEPVLLVRRMAVEGDMVVVKHCVDTPPQHGSVLTGELQPFEKRVGNVSTNSDDSLFYQLIWPKPRLFIFGAGVDARPLAKVSAGLGWNVHVIDWRQEYCNKEHFPNDVTCHVAPFEHFIDENHFTRLDSVVVMTHEFQRDQSIVKVLVEKELFYLGVLGPKARTTKLLEEAWPPAFIDSPAGLSIGADGPEEIAISIVGAIISRLRQPVKEGVDHL